MLEQFLLAMPGGFSGSERLYSLPYKCGNMTNSDEEEIFLKKSFVLMGRDALFLFWVLYSVFYSSIQNSEIPDILKLGYICPILKTDSKRENPASWRPVSLTSHVVKTLERVLRKQIVILPKLMIKLIILR